MTDELFPVEESLSPKNAWIKKHKLVFYKDNLGDWHVESEATIEKCWIEIKQYYGNANLSLQEKLIQLLIDSNYLAPDDVLYQSKDDAIVRWAKINHIPLWQEEEYKKQMKANK